MKDPERAKPSSRLAGRKSAAEDLSPFSVHSLANALLDRLASEGFDPAGIDSRSASLLGLLSVELDLAVSDQFHNAYGSARSWVRFIQQHPDVDAVEWSGAVALELGCGALNPLGSVAELIVRGLRVRSLDIDPLERTDVVARRAYWLLIDCAARLGFQLPSSIDWARLRAGDLDGISRDVWQFHSAPADASGLEAESVDLCVSNSFLEHVPDPEAVLRESARVSVPGGLAIHKIDFRDHRSYGDPAVHPLEFLTESEDHALVRGCNRLRHSDFLDLFSAVGFEVRHVEYLERIEFDEVYRPRLSPRFRDCSAEDLSLMFVGYHLRRQS